MANSPYPATKNLFLYQGDYWYQDFPHDYGAIGNDNIGFAISRAPGELPFFVATLADFGDIEVVNGTDEAQIFLSTAVTSLFDPGIYYYDMQLTRGQPITIYRGRLTVEGEAFRGPDLVMSYPSTAVTNLLVKWTLGQLWSYTSISRDVDGVLTSASVRWPDNTVGTLTRTAKDATWQAVTSFTVSYNALTVTQSAITFDVNGNLATRPRPTVA